MPIESVKDKYIVLSDLKRWGFQRMAASVMYVTVPGCHNETGIYLGPFQDRHLAATYITTVGR